MTDVEFATMEEVRRQRDELLERCQKLIAFVETVPSLITQARLDVKAGNQTHYDYGLHRKLIQSP